jgi:bifunctional DNA-binding transcriptional regulator/antitoxin component of YhaV-PrlF toxin-antitoxin module
MASETVQMRAKGNITIPAELRKKYALEDGDVFTLIDLGDGSFFVVPRVSIVPKLVAELEAMREEAGVTIEELLEDVPKIRRSVYEERYRDLY